MSFNDEISILPPEETVNVENNLPTGQSGARKKGLFVFVLEPAVFLIFFGLNLSGTVIKNQIIYNTCTNVYGFNQTDCAVLGMKESTDKSQEIENVVQPYVAKIIMTRTLIESIIPAVFSLFFGPWSDKYGRKPVIFVSILGYFLGYVILCPLAFFSSQFPINPWLFIMSAIPIAVTGGNCALITGVFCYITDVAVAKNRAYRMVLNEAAVYVGLFFGSILSSYLLAATNASLVLMTSGIVLFLAIVYVLIFVDESIYCEEVNNATKFRELFRFSLIKDMISTCFEKRPNYDRAIIWLTMLSLGISIFVMDGDDTVFYLFVMDKFGWTIKEYTLYDAICIVIVVFGNIIGMFLLQKVMRLSITSLVLVSFGGYVLDAIVKATAIYSWQLYLAVSIGFLKGISGPMCRAIISHVAPTRDLGKLYSFTTSIETITPLGSAPLYAYVYGSTMSTNPGFFNYISSGLYLVCYIFIATIFGIQKSSPPETYEAIG